MKLIVFTDLHVSEKSEDLVFNEILPGILDVGRGSTIAFLGDWYQARYVIPVRLQNKTKAWINQCRLEKTKLVLLAGNHDQINAEGDNALSVFNDFSNVEVISQPTTTELGLWIPYRKEGFKELLKRCLKESWGPKYLWMHQGAKGALMDNGRLDDDGIDLSHFAGWKVNSGHYHKHHVVGNITYVGSPYQTRAGEAGNANGFMEFDLEDGSSVFQARRWGKRYHRLAVASNDYVLGDDVGMDDEIRLTTAPGVDVDTLGERLRNQGYQNVTITPLESGSEQRLKLSGDDTRLDSYAQAYVEHVEPENTARLMRVYKGIVHED